MTIKSIAAVLAAATTLAAASAAPLRADDAGSVVKQVPGWSAEARGGLAELVARGSGLFASERPGGTKSAEGDKSVHGDHNDRN